WIVGAVAQRRNLEGALHDGVEFRRPRMPAAGTGAVVDTERGVGKPVTHLRYDPIQLGLYPALPVMPDPAGSIDKAHTPARAHALPDAILQRAVDGRMRRSKD